jgi:hypothetical protein
MGINELPIELADEIIRPLCMYCTPFKKRPTQMHDTERKRISSLASLCLMSRCLNVTATPHLYHYLPGRKWALIGRTLLARKDLAQLPRALRFHDYWNGDRFDSSPALVEYFTSRFQDYRDELSDDDREYFDWQLQETMFADAFHNLPLDIVASLCPNLETVSATLAHPETFRFNPALSLPRLHTASFTYHDHRDGGIDLLSLKPLFLAAPNLASLTFTRLDGSTQNLDGDGVILAAPPAPQLRHLDCRYSSISLDMLIGILTSCPRLETFKYAWGGHNVGAAEFSLPDAADAIEAYAPATLKLFRMSVADDEVSWPFEWMEEDASEVRRRLAERGVCFQFSLKNMDGVEWRGGVDG